jgi:hypothetical protein
MVRCCCCRHRRCHCHGCCCCCCCCCCLVDGCKHFRTIHILQYQNTWRLSQYVILKLLPLKLKTYYISNCLTDCMVS